MAKIKGAIVIDKEKCKGCELCIDVCPTHVIDMAQEVNRKGYRFAYPKNHDECTGCENCAIICPDGVITVYRKKIEVVETNS